MGEIREPRMYQLVRQKEPVADAMFDIGLQDAGVEVFPSPSGRNQRPVILREIGHNG